MEVLVLYRKFRLLDRATIRDHLYSLKRYANDCHFTYLDLTGPRALHKAILRYPFQAVIFHYTFLAARFDEDFNEQYAALKPLLQQIQGYKIFIVHDEYVFTQALWRMIRDLSVSHVFATCYPEDYDTLFPCSETGQTDLCSTVFPGYVEERRIKKLQRRWKRSRPIDIGYRALRSDYSFGLHGHLKTQIALEMQKAAQNDADLHVDIRLTEEGYRNMIVGDRWFDFLCSCRTSIGCLGGSSLMDPTGSLRNKTLRFVHWHREAEYSDVERNCYPGQDGAIHSHIFGPKIFECAMTKTCQILVEDDYRGVLTADVDYIPMKADFSNLDVVIQKIKDEKYCKTVAENCYQNLVLSGKYTYRVFAQEIQNHILKHVCRGYDKAGTISEGALLQCCVFQNDVRHFFVLIVHYCKHKLAMLLHTTAPSLYRRIWEYRHADRYQTR